MGTYAYDAANDALSLVAGTGDTDALAAKLTKTSNNIAPLQSGSTASSLIPVGEYFINSNGDLCQCDVQINADSAIVIGTNCHVVQKGISNELNSNSGLSFTVLASGAATNVAANTPVDIFNGTVDGMSSGDIILIRLNWAAGTIVTKLNICQPNQSNAFLYHAQDSVDYTYVIYTPMIIAVGSSLRIQLQLKAAQSTVEYVVHKLGHITI